VASDTALTEHAPEAVYREKRDQYLRVALMLFARYGTLLALGVMFIAFSIQASGFLTTGNLLNVLSQISITAIIAGGLTIVLAAGEFDLSIGWVASFAGVMVTGLMAHQHLSILVAILVALALGASIGIFNGLIVTKLGVNALIATLGTGTVVVGFNYLYGSGLSISLGIPPSFSNIALSKAIPSIPNPIVIMAAVFALLWVFLNLTARGQEVQAVGGNAEASRLSGIRVERVKILAFAISGTCAAAGGVLLASLLGSGQSTAGDSYLLDAFAAVFLGSAALRDGEFHIVGTLIGVLTVGIGFNGLALFGAATFYQYMFKGGLLIAAVALSSIARRYAK